MEVPRTLVIIPAYNEGKNIAGVIADVQSLGFDSILVICNGCQDDTAKQAQKAGATVIRIPEASIGEAFRLALRYAIKNNFDYLLRTDADDQFYPEDLVKIVAALLQGEADVAVGVRKSLGANPWRQLGCRSIALLLTVLTKGELCLSDANCGLIGFSKHAFEPLSHREYGRWPEAETILYVHLHHLLIKTVKVSVKGRHRGQSSISFWGGISLVVKSMLRLPWLLAMSKLEHQTTGKE
ncbi:MAG: glycosyltransferase family 2 protein [Parcubacteria group bacterium]